MRKTKGRRLFRDRLKEDLKSPTFRKAYDEAEEDVTKEINRTLRRDRTNTGQVSESPKSHNKRI